MWLSPEMFEQSREMTLAYLVRATAAQAFGAVASFYASH